MDIYRKKSQLEYSQHLVGLFHSLTLSAEWVFLQIKADRRRGKEKTRDCKEEVAGSTPEAESDSLPSLHVLQPRVVPEGGNTRHPKTPGETTPLTSLINQMEPCSSSKEEQHPKMCKRLLRSSLISV